MASWMYKKLLSVIGWVAPLEPSQAKELLDFGAKFIDVRSPGEFAAGHLPDAENIPLERVADALADREGSFILYCQSGMRSRQACRMIERRGGPAVHNLGGMSNAKRVLARIESAE